MDWVATIFYLFSAIAIVAATAVVSVRNPVYALLSLILTFFSVACLWVLIGAEFLGVTLIVVYVGAVMVMFLFVVMMLEMDRVHLRESGRRYLPAGVLVAGIMFVQLVVLLGIRTWTQTALPVHPEGAMLTNLVWLARALCTQFILPFEFAAIILTVAVIAAVMLTLRKREGIKTQNPSEQARANPQTRVRLVSIPAQQVSMVYEEPKAQDPTDTTQQAER